MIISARSYGDQWHGYGTIWNKICQSSSSSLYSWSEREISNDDLMMMRLLWWNDLIVFEQYYTQYPVTFTPIMLYYMSYRIISPVPPASANITHVYSWLKDKNLDLKRTGLYFDQDFIAVGAGWTSGGTSGNKPITYGTNKRHCVTVSRKFGGEQNGHILL